MRRNEIARRRASPGGGRFRLTVVCGLVALVVSQGCGNEVRPIPLVPVPVTDSSPSWSSDGTLLAYVHFNPDVTDTVQPSGVYVTTLGGAWRCVARVSVARSVDWSPDGRRLVYDGLAGLHVVGVDGDRDTTIYPGGMEPSWSPTGEEIAFSTIARVWGIRPDGTGLRPLTPADSVAGDPDWSPDGRHLVVLDNPHSRGEEVMTVRLSDGAFTRLTHDDHEDRSPTWSPSGGRIAWIAIPVVDGRARSVLCVMDTLGTNLHSVIATTSAPAWDPAGERLAIALTTAHGPRLFVVGADGAGLVQVTH